MTRIQRIRVPAGMAFAIVLIYWAEPSPVFYLCGLLVAATGLGIRIWAAGCLQKFQKLSISGPYRWSRNPLYVGSFLMGFGLSVAGGKLWLVFLFVVLFFIIYFPVMRREERELDASYGRNYRAYKKQVPRFFPLRRRGALPEEFITSRADRFQWSRVLENREYRAVIGFLLMFAVLFFKGC